MTKWKKRQKLMQGLHPNHMHIIRRWRKHVQSLKSPQRRIRDMI